MRRNWAILISALISILGITILLVFWHWQSSSHMPTPDASPAQNQTTTTQISTNQYPAHKNITATTFWIGESADGSNNFISNAASAWDENWQVHYGGVDDPSNRNGFMPANFTPGENPFYFALPYNDFDGNGNRKADAGKIIYWAADSSWDASQSMLKNQWIKITKNGTDVYAQWEDVGPFGESDSTYVFGSSAPQSGQNSHAGLDLSPAVRDYLHLNGEDNVDWQFVKEKDVPAGPWKKIITTS